MHDSLHGMMFVAGRIRCGTNTIPPGLFEEVIFAATPTRPRGAGRGDVRCYHDVALAATGAVSADVNASMRAFYAGPDPCRPYLPAL